MLDVDRPAGSLPARRAASHPDTRAATPAAARAATDNARHAIHRATRRPAADRHVARISYRGALRRTAARLARQSAARAQPAARRRCQLQCRDAKSGRRPDPANGPRRIGRASPDLARHARPDRATAGDLDCLVRPGAAPGAGWRIARAACAGSRLRVCRRGRKRCPRLAHGRRRRAGLARQRGALQKPG